jgi:hypothetical protein
MERLFDSSKCQEQVNGIDVSLTREASLYLKSLMMQPNPHLAEFGYLGLGDGKTIDQILAIDEDLRQRKLTADSPRLDGASIRPLFVKLVESGRENDFMMFGHSHPIGVRVVEGKYYWIVPNKKLLEPSMGTPEQGGPSKDWDIGFFKWFYEKVVNVPFVGISTNVDESSKLRIYDTERLINISAKKDLKHVPQVTLNL